MAGLFLVPEQQHLDVLDPGTGSAILTAALMERLSTHSGLASVSLICYETEPAILALLKDNLDYIKANVPFELNYTIISENYITSQQNPKPMADLVIGNPPYLKVNRQAPEACAMPKLFMVLQIFTFCSQPAVSRICVIGDRWSISFRVPGPPELTLRHFDISFLKMLQLNICIYSSAVIRSLSRNLYCKKR